MYFVCFNGILNGENQIIPKCSLVQTMDNYEMKNISMEWWRCIEALKKRGKYQPKEGREKRIKNNINIQIWKISALRGRQKKS